VALMRECGAEVKLEDKRHAGDPIDVGFQGVLRPEQTKAVEAVLAHDIGVFCAPTAFGKTVAAAAVIAARKTNTLIIVHRTQLLDQWRNRLSAFLQIDDRSIGAIGAGKRFPTGLIDVAIMQSLVRKGTVRDIVANYGHVIVDECHHVSAFSFELVMKEVKAQFANANVQYRQTRILASTTMRLLCTARLAPAFEIGDQFLFRHPETGELGLHPTAGLQQRLPLGLARPLGHGNIEPDGLPMASYLDRDAGLRCAHRRSRTSRQARILHAAR